MKFNYLLVVVASVGLIAFSGTAQATVIVDETFTGGGDGASLVGRTPGTDLPGATWVAACTYLDLDGTAGPLWSTTTTAFGNPVPGAYGGYLGSAAISIASSGSYSKPPMLTIAADLAPRSLAGDATGGRGIGLGFYSATGGFIPNNYFTGLLLDAAGNLDLVQDPNATGFYSSGSYRGAQVAWSGATFDPYAFHRLSYDVNTATGHISNISLEGSSADYSSFNITTLFTDAATMYAGISTSSTSGNTYGAVDNIQVSGVPEPTVVTMLVTALVGLLCYAWRKRR